MAYPPGSLTLHKQPTMALVVGVMCKLAWDGHSNMKVRDLEESIVRGLVSGDYAGECFATYAWMCRNFRYLLDPNSVEFTRWPQGQFDSISGTDAQPRFQEDCDGHAVFSAALLMSAGKQCFFALASFDPSGVPSHVFTVVNCRGKGLMAIDSVARGDTEKMLRSCTSLTLIDCERGVDVPIETMAPSLGRIPFNGWGGWKAAA